MAGIFGFFDVTRPGKGVEKDEAEKQGLALFGQLLWRKLWKYMKLSMLYFLTCIPTLIIVTVFGLLIFSGRTYQNAENAYGWFSISVILGMFSLVFYSGTPFHAGLSYILRNFVRQEHAWLWSDFIDRTKRNFKQAIIVYLIDLAVAFCLIVALNFYLGQIFTSIPGTVMSVLFIIASIFYSTMHDYIWTMMVTIDLNLKNIYKNAMLFTILGFLKNLLSFVLRAVVFGIVFYYLNLVVGIFVYAFLLLGASHLLAQVYSYPHIKKYLIDPQMPKEDETDESTALTEPEDTLPENDVTPLEPNDIASIFQNSDNTDL